MLRSSRQPEDIRRGSEGTEARLVLAAERLFAAHGVRAVSLRAVMNEAEANVASVHYHFGSKDALLEAVVRSRLDEVTDTRSAVLDELASAKNLTARDLAQALIGPVVQLVENGGRDWVKLIGSLLSSNDPGLTPISESFFERNARFVELMERHDPEASRGTLSFRLTQAMTLTLHVLGDGDNVRSLLSGQGETWTSTEVTNQLLDVVASVLAGPPDERRG